MNNEKFWTIIFIPKNYLNQILKKSNSIYLRIFLVFVAPVFMSVLVLMVLIKGKGIEGKQKEKKDQIKQNQFLDKLSKLLEEKK